MATVGIDPITTEIVRSAFNAAADEIVFRLPKLQEYRSWQQVLNTTEIEQAPADFAPGAEASAPPRSVLAFAGSP